MMFLSLGMVKFMSFGLSPNSFNGVHVAMKFWKKMNLLTSTNENILDNIVSLS